MSCFVVQSLALGLKKKKSYVTKTKQWKKEKNTLVLFSSLSDSDSLSTYLRINSLNMVLF